MMTKLLLILMMVGFGGCGYLIKTHTENYDNGKMSVHNGKWVEYYESGEVKKEGNYVDGKKEGKWVEYYESGKVEIEKNHVNGKREDKWVWYYESGDMEWEGNFVDDKHEGKWVGYYESGKVDFPQFGRRCVASL
jgi:antitoxin component YwqK of YwqJK toxin-antitoxin module